MSIVNFDSDYPPCCSYDITMFRGFLGTFRVDKLASHLIRNLTVHDLIFYLLWRSLKTLNLMESNTSDTSRTILEHHSWDQNANRINIKNGKVPKNGEGVTIYEGENKKDFGRKGNCKSNDTYIVDGSKSILQKVPPGGKVLVVGETKPESGSGSTAVKFENIAKSFKIVKSNALKRKNQTLDTQTGSVSKLDFSSKIVKITEEEFNGTKPKRARSWRSEKKLRERREAELKLNKSNSSEPPKQSSSPEDHPNDSKAATKTPEHYGCCCDCKAFQEDNILKAIFENIDNSILSSDKGGSGYGHEEGYFWNSDLESLEDILRTDLKLNIALDTDTPKTLESRKYESGDRRTGPNMHLQEGNVYSCKDNANGSSVQSSFCKSWDCDCLRRRIIVMLRMYLRKRKEMRVCESNYSKTKNEVSQKSEECLKREKKNEGDNKWLPLKKRGCSRMVSSS